ncbi:hypothetical protein HF923_13805 [Acidithiobacillus ferriphilus]|nr:hypothetical protein [Acidithiobacillus ferriphilus]
MPVKKLGSKLAQGVRQVQAQQVEASAPDTQADALNTGRPGKELLPSSSNPTEEKRPSAPRSESHKSLHPRRVWPD